MSSWWLILTFVSPKVLTQANMSTALHLTMINKQPQVLKVEPVWTRQFLYMIYLLPSKWPAQIQVSLCTLPLSFGLKHTLQCHKHLSVSLQPWPPITRYNSDESIVISIIATCESWMYSLGEYVYSTIWPFNKSWFKFDTYLWKSRPKD
jgi:hypothetical protein